MREGCLGGRGGYVVQEFHVHCSGRVCLHSSNNLVSHLVCNHLCLKLYVATVQMIHGSDKPNMQ